MTTTHERTPDERTPDARTTGTSARRMRLNREAVLQRAVELADAESLEAVSMRRLAAELDVVPMALYKHVAGKDDLAAGMLDIVVREIADPPTAGAAPAAHEAGTHGSTTATVSPSPAPTSPAPTAAHPAADPSWRAVLRSRILAARASLLRHPWALSVIESSTSPTPAVLDHLEGTIAVFLRGGFSPALTHQLMHALGSRMWGFTHELFPSPPPATPEAAAAAAAALAEHYPGILTIAGAARHNRDGILGPGCDDQYEFEFALDLLLDGFEARRVAGGL